MAPLACSGRAACAVALGLALVASPGCFVLDELEAGDAMLEKRLAAKRGERPPPEEAPRASGRPAAPPAPRAKKAPGAAREAVDTLASWWQEARSLAPGSAPEGIVRCRLDGREIFTREEDCTGRGGSAVR